jgi:hypothetical protein
MSFPRETAIRILQEHGLGLCAALEQHDYSGANLMALLELFYQALPGHTPSETKDNPDARDARRWRALLNCARIRVLGHAGFQRDQGDYRHIGMEVWTQHSVVTTGSAKQLLTEFADAAERENQLREAGHAVER